MKLEDLKINYEDQRVYDLFELGDTAGLFQMEAVGTSRLTSKIAPRSIQEIADATALIRPGPKDSGELDHYTKRKHGKEKPDSLYPPLDEVLKNTFNVVIFQEQQMKIAQILAGWSLQESDILRDGIAKKRTEELKSLKPKFYEDCKKNEVPEKVIDRVWKNFEASAFYSFNLSHSIEYGYTTYHTAWLKTYYPKAFYYGNLNCIERDSDPISEVRKFCLDAKRHGVQIKIPNHREMTEKFELKDGVIYWGLTAIKGLSINDVPAIIKNGISCRSFDDFVLGCSKDNVKVSSTRAIIYAGFLDNIGGGDPLTPPEKASLRDFMARRLEIIHSFSKPICAALYQISENKTPELETDLQSTRDINAKIKQTKVDEYIASLNKCVPIKIPVALMAQKETEYLGPIMCDLGGQDPIYNIEYNSESICKGVIIDKKEKYKNGKLSTMLIIQDSSGILFKYIDGNTITAEKLDVITFKTHRGKFEII